MSKKGLLTLIFLFLTGHFFVDTQARDVPNVRIHKGKENPFAQKFDLINSTNKLLQELRNDVLNHIKALASKIYLNEQMPFKATSSSRMLANHYQQLAYGTSKAQLDDFAFGKNSGSLLKKSKVDIDKHVDAQTVMFAKNLHAQHSQKELRPSDDAQKNFSHSQLLSSRFNYLQSHLNKAHVQNISFARKKGSLNNNTDVVIGKNTDVDTLFFARGVHAEPSNNLVNNNIDNKSIQSSSLLSGNYNYLQKRVAKAHVNEFTFAQDENFLNKQGHVSIGDNADIQTTLFAKKMHEHKEYNQSEENQVAVVDSGCLLQSNYRYAQAGIQKAQLKDVTFGQQQGVLHNTSVVKLGNNADTQTLFFAKKMHEHKEYNQSEENQVTVVDSGRLLQSNYRYAQAGIQKAQLKDVIFGQQQGALHNTSVVKLGNNADTQTLFFAKNLHKKNIRDAEKNDTKNISSSRFLAGDYERNRQYLVRAPLKDYAFSTNSNCLDLTNNIVLGDNADIKTTFFAKYAHATTDEGENSEKNSIESVDTVGFLTGNYKYVQDQLAKADFDDYVFAGQKGLLAKADVIDVGDNADVKTLFFAKSFHDKDTVQKDEDNAETLSAGKFIASSGQYAQSKLAKADFDDYVFADQKGLLAKADVIDVGDNADVKTLFFAKSFHDKETVQQDEKNNVYVGGSKFLAGNYKYAQKYLQRAGVKEYAFANNKGCLSTADVINLGDNADAKTLFFAKNLHDKKSDYAVGLESQNDSKLLNDRYHYLCEQYKKTRVLEYQDIEKEGILTAANNAVLGENTDLTRGVFIDNIYKSKMDALARSQSSQNGFKQFGYRQTCALAKDTLFSDNQIAYDKDFFSERKNKKYFKESIKQPVAISLAADSAQAVKETKKSSKNNKTIHYHDNRTINYYSNEQPYESYYALVENSNTPHDKRKPIKLVAHDAQQGRLFDDGIERIYFNKPAYYWDLQAGDRGQVVPALAISSHFAFKGYDNNQELVSLGQSLVGKCPTIGDMFLLSRLSRDGELKLDCDQNQFGFNPEEQYLFYLAPVKVGLDVEEKAVNIDFSLLYNFVLPWGYENIRGVVGANVPLKSVRHDLDVQLIGGSLFQKGNTEHPSTVLTNVLVDFFKDFTSINDFFQRAVLDPKGLTLEKRQRKMGLADINTFFLLDFKKYFDVIDAFQVGVNFVWPTGNTADGDKVWEIILGNGGGVEAELFSNLTFNTSYNYLNPIFFLSARYGFEYCDKQRVPRFVFNTVEDKAITDDSNNPTIDGLLVPVFPDAKAAQFAEFDTLVPLFADNVVEVERNPGITVNFGMGNYTYDVFKADLRLGLFYHFMYKDRDSIFVDCSSKTVKYDTHLLEQQSKQWMHRLGWNLTYRAKHPVEVSFGSNHVVVGQNVGRTHEIYASLSAAF